MIIRSNQSVIIAKLETNKMTDQEIFDLMPEPGQMLEIVIEFSETRKI